MSTIEMDMEMIRKRLQEAHFTPEQVDAFAEIFEEENKQRIVKKDLEDISTAYTSSFTKWQAKLDAISAQIANDNRLNSNDLTHKFEFFSSKIDHKFDNLANDLKYEITGLSDKLDRKHSASVESNRKSTGELATLINNLTTKLDAEFKVIRSEISTSGTESKKDVADAKTELVKLGAGAILVNAITLLGLILLVLKDFGWGPLPPQ